MFFKIPEYCKTVDEKEIFQNAFELLSAFDEIVALGYKENVNLAQIRTYTEMDSHDERVYDAMRQVLFFIVLKLSKYISLSIVSRT
jgi:hypothetical protein